MYVCRFWWFLIFSVFYITLTYFTKFLNFRNFPCFISNGNILYSFEHETWMNIASERFMTKINLKIHKYYNIKCMWVGGFRCFFFHLCVCVKKFRDFFPTFSAQSSLKHSARSACIVYVCSVVLFINLTNRLNVMRGLPGKSCCESCDLFYTSFIREKFIVRKIGTNFSFILEPRKGERANKSKDEWS